MAIDLFEELWNERKGTLDKSFHNTFTRSFIVHTDAVEQSYISIYNAIYAHGNCPQIGNLYPGDNDSYAQSVNINPEADDPQTWKVIVEYGSIPPGNVETQNQGQKPEDREANPTLRPPDFRVTFISFPEVLTNLRNSAGDPFVPPITIERFRPVFTIGCNVSTIDAYDLATYIGKVNNATNTFVTGTGCTLTITDKTGKIKGIGTELILEGQYQYWRLTYEIEINTTITDEEITGWDLIIRDQGFNILKANNEKVPIIRGGAIATTPVDLDGAGLKNPDGENPVYITFPASDVYGEIDFATLPGLGFF